MHENLILANAAKSRHAYDLVVATGHSAQLSDIGTMLWNAIEDYYSHDEEAAEVNLVLLQESVRQRMTSKAADRAAAIVDSFEGQASPENFAEVLLEGRRQALREAMIMDLADKKDSDFYDLFRQFEELDELAAPDSTSILGSSPADLIEVALDAPGIPLATPQLNACLRGGVLPGSHTLIFGRPEIGKSLFALNCIAEAVRNGFRVGFWENEDTIEVTQLRAVQAILQCTEEELRDMTPATEKRLRQAGWYDRCFFRDAPGAGLHDLDQWVRQHDLQMCVVNQFANLRTNDQDNRTLQLGALARGVRDIGKTTGCAMLSVHQAGDSAEGRRVLRMGDLDWSNTSIQAAIDVLIGYGADEDLLLKNQRMLSLCKNKRAGTHDRVLVDVDMTRGILT